MVSKPASLVSDESKDRRESDDFELLKSSLDFAKAIYFDATTTIRHYDTLRTSFTQMFASFIAIASSALTAASIQSIAPRVLPWIAGALLSLSVLSVLAIVKFDSLILLQRSRAKGAMDIFQSQNKTLDLLAINENARAASGILARLRLAHVWFAIFVVLSLANLGLLLASIS